MQNRRSERPVKAYGRKEKRVEFAPLEGRLMMCADDALLHGHKLGHNFGTFPALTAEFNADLPVGTGADVVGPSAGSMPLGAVPQLDSNPSAAKKLYLDFTGAAPMAWGSFAVPVTPAYDQDGDPTTFSTGEIASIDQIWARVAEKYSPFNIDVTTVDPGTYTKGQSLRAVIGGDGAWLGDAGGVAYVDSFTKGPTTVWIFPKNLGNGDPHYTAEAASHEPGHAFGLQHQSTYDSLGNKTEYNPGNSLVAPVMGTSYYSERGLWWLGTSSVSPTSIQDDMAVISKTANAFGYRPQDHGQTPAAADPLAVSGNSVSGSGIIAKTTDTDFFSFTTGPGAVSLGADVAAYGPTLDLKLLLLDGGGNVIASADTASLGESVSTNLPGGTYSLEVASHGSYGDVGQYTVHGTIVAPAASAPAAPSALAAARSDTGATSQVNLTWADNSTGEWGFRIERSTDGANFAPVATAPAESTSYTDGTADAGQTYVYRVVAYDGVGDSGYSNVVYSTPDVTGVAAGSAAIFSLSGAAGSQTLSVTAGVLSLTQDLSAAYPGIGLLVSNGASVAFNAPQHLASLTLSGGAAATAVGGGQAALALGGLSIDAASSLDLTDNDLLVSRVDDTVPAAVRSYLASGYKGNTWAGNGIRSSSAASDPTHYSLGYADGGVTTIAPAGQVLVRYTRRGDATLDRKVDIQDLLKFRANSGATTGGQWWQADFTYDGKVDIQDLLAFRANSGTSVSAGSETIAASANQPIAGASAAAASSAQSSGVFSNTPVVLIGGHGATKDLL
jgi:hypothetical protein